MVEKRKKWRAITIAIFVLAVVMAFSNRFLPKPVLETEAVVEQYLLTRTLFILATGVLAFLGLLTMFKYLRCPHCGAFGLKQIQFCTNCGKDLDAEVVVEEVSEETAENAEAIGAPAAAEIAESSEAAEPVDENK